MDEFLKANGVESHFNLKQRIILVSSDYDEQTMSAVAWLNSNNVDISCYKLIPYKINNDIFLEADKILPLPEYKDYYVNLMDKSSTVTLFNSKKDITRRSLPKIDEMLEWGVVKAGDIIAAKNKEENEGTLLKNGNVIVNGKELSMQVWLKELYGWSSVQTYVFAVHKETGKTLSQIREDYMSSQDAETSEALEDENV